MNGKPVGEIERIAFLEAQLNGMGRRRVHHALVWTKAHQTSWHPSFTLSRENVATGYRNHTVASPAAKQYGPNSQNHLPLSALMRTARDT